MKILILGGTVFVGRHLVETALARGHTLTLFNRGQSGADLYPQVEQLRGDRDGDLAALEGRDWDAVIDTCGYLPRVVRQSSGLLKGHAQQYVFISSLSAYADIGPEGGDESNPLETMEDESAEEIGRYYGALKVLCEKAVMADFPGAALIVRPGMIVGPYDKSPRLAYWLRRVAAGGEVLAPGTPELPLQIVDVRDMDAWLLDMMEAQRSGIYDVTGPMLCFGDFLDSVRRITGGDVRYIWVDDAALQAQGVQPVDDVKYWLPAEYHGLFKWSIAKARAAGFTSRPLDDTLRDTWAWLQTQPPATEGVGPRSIGISREREAEILRRAHG